jgi:hypothetical protein
MAAAIAISTRLIAFMLLPNPFCLAALRQLLAGSVAIGTAIVLVASMTADVAQDIPALC